MSKATLTIRTNLGQQESEGDKGPFLLASVQGVEGFSIPYSFDLTLYRALSDKDVDPSLLIDTPAKYGVLFKGDKYLTRSGVFKSFEKAGTTEVANTAQTNFIIYNAKLVPAIAMLEFEQVFRVFEQMDVIEIIEEAIGDFANINVATYLVKRLGSPKFPKIDYCVQYNETTFAFISRLLGEYGIWYYFEHPGPADNRIVEQMVLGFGPATFPACEDEKMTIDPRNFSRAYQVAHRRTGVGEYNILSPHRPVFAHVKVHPAYDAAPGDGATGLRMERDVFPAATPQFDPEGDVHALTSDAAVNQLVEEARVFTVQGQGANASFRVGRRFTTTDDTEAKKIPADKDQFGPPAVGEFLLTRVSISAVEGAFGHSFWDDVINQLNPMHWFNRPTGSAAKVMSVTSAIAASSLYKSIDDELTNPHWFDKGLHKLEPFTSKLASIMGPVGSVLSFLTDAVSEIVNRHSDSYSNAFVGVPWKPGTFSALPLPLYAAARAYGPQSAMVVGPAGLDGNSSDLQVDALGRVRVRFPWHTRLPDGGEKDPWKTDRRTAWLRVAEGWAGQGMGTQFLPRIGDEVIVSFLDGDPACPIITGRLYNAATGSPGHPFPPDRSAAKLVPDNAVHQPKRGSASLRSGVRTRSTPKPKGAKDRFHLIRFDDAWHDEQFLIRSQGRTDVTSFGAWHDTSHGDRSILVGGKDPDTGKGGGAMFVTTGGEYDHHVGGSHYHQADKTYQLTVKSATAFDLESDYFTVVKGKVEMNASEVVIEATHKITLKVGGSFVVVDPMGVFIKGAVVKINSGGSPGDTSSTEMIDVADAGAADPGDPPDWLARHPPGKGGKRGTHTAEAKHGLIVTKTATGYQVTKGVSVKGDDAYCDSVIQDLATINDTKDGKARLDRLDASGKQTTIQNFDAANPKFAQPNATTAATNDGDATAVGKLSGATVGGNPVPGTGRGSDSVIRYDPADWPDPTTRTKAPGDSILNHELGHADNNAAGKRDLTPTTQDSYGNMEEFNNLPADNSYRHERNPDPAFQRRDYGDF